jgi:hypothetical protein
LGADVSWVGSNGRGAAMRVRLPLSSMD